MLLSLLLMSLSLAGEPHGPGSVGWNTLQETADEAFDRGPGVAWDARTDALDAARRAEPSPLQSFFLQLEPDPRPGANALEGLQAAVQIGIGDRRGRQRALWQSLGHESRAGETEQRWRFHQAVTDDFLTWWLADAIAEHLAEHADELDAWLAPFVSGVAQGTMSAAQLDDLRAEVSRLRAEVADAAYEAEVARGALSSRLGWDAHPVTGGLATLSAVAVEARNPWRALPEVLDRHPAIARLDAAIRSAEAQAAAARWSTPAQLGVGTSVRTGADGTPQVVPLLLLTVPLSNPDAPLARTSMGEARALAAEAGWERVRLAAWVRAEADALDAAQQRWQSLDTAVEQPLRARLKRLEDGLVRGLAGATEVILARRDLHEAFHRRTLAAAEVLRRRARGDVLLDLIHPTSEASP